VRQSTSQQFDFQSLVGITMTRKVLCPLLLLLSQLALVLPSALGSGKPAQAFVGTLVDLTCATDPKKDLAKLRSEHTRKCLLMPVCSESGYALLTDDDQVLKFDREGNKLAGKLIAEHSRNQNWRITVAGVPDGGYFNVLRIKLWKGK
jgi:hypothetical protein